MVKVVLISGKQGSGKTTLAQNILQEWRRFKKHDARCISFADSIYEMHDHCLGVLRSAGIDRGEKDGYLLQLLGTEWGRAKVDPDIWVKLAHAKINRMETTVASLWSRFLVIIADCRFRNELAGFPGAVKIRLSCEEDLRKGRASMWRETTNHPSEIDLDEFDQPGLRQKHWDLWIDTGKVDAAGASHLAVSHLLRLDSWPEQQL